MVVGKVESGPCRACHRLGKVRHCAPAALNFPTLVDNLVEIIKGEHGLGDSGSDATRSRWSVLLGKSFVTGEHDERHHLGRHELIDEGSFCGQAVGGLAMRLWPWFVVVGCWPPPSRPAATIIFFFACWWPQKLANSQNRQADRRTGRSKQGETSDG